MPRIAPATVDEWLVPHLRNSLRAEGIDAQVDVVEPPTLDAPLARPLVVVRTDGGTQSSPLTFSCQVGISVLAGTRQNDALARRVASLVYAAATDMEIVFASGSPITAVNYRACTTPVGVSDDQDVARRYMTISYMVVGSW